MRYVGLGLVISLPLLLASCGEGGSASVQNPQPPINTLPPGLPSAVIANKTLSGSVQLTIESDLAFLPNFGPDSVDLQLTVSEGAISDPNNYLVAVEYAVAGENNPPVSFDLTNSEGELQLLADFSALCDSDLVFTIDASINPENTINIAAIDRAETCAGFAISIQASQFSLVEEL